MRIDHIGLWASDPEAARAFYETYFGAVAGPKHTNPAKGFESYVPTFLGDVRLEVMRVAGLGANASGGPAVGYAHLAPVTGRRARGRGRPAPDWGRVLRVRGPRPRREPHGDSRLIRPCDESTMPSNTHEPPMRRSDLPSGHVRIFESDGHLEFRTTPISVPGGLVMLAFAVAFIVLALRGAPPDASDRLSSIGMVALALGLLVPAIWVLSHQRLALSADGVLATRSVFGVPIRRRRVPLLKVGPARSQFSHAGGDESPDVYILEIGAAPRPIRFGSGCGEAELKGLADRFNAFKKALGSTT